METNLRPVNTDIHKSIVLEQMVQYKDHTFLFHSTCFCNLLDKDHAHCNSKLCGIPLFLPLAPLSHLLDEEEEEEKQAIRTWIYANYNSFFTYDLFCSF